MSKPVGVRCPECRSTRSNVIDSRDSPVGRRRRRKCIACKTAYTTWEMTEATVHTYDIRDVYKALSEIENIAEKLKQSIGDFGNDEDGI